ncbi:MAG: bifunctional UDP-sugar hydrolase/5'-nucleotidase [Kofleriaceae bacterium]
MKTPYPGYYLAPMRWILSMTLLCAATGCLIEQDQPDLAGQDVRFTIIHTSDIHSRLFPYNFVPNTFDQDYGLLPANGPFGGIARIGTMVKRIRVSTGRSLWLDSGDAWEGAPVFNEFKGEAEIRALSLAGMDGEVLGNHEFDLGTKQLVTQLDNWSQFPHLVANYAFDDPANPSDVSLADVTSPFEIYDVKGIKVGVIGMGNQDTLLSAYEGGNSLGIRPIDNATALEGYVRLIRPYVDLVVVVSHLGLDNDEGLSPSQVDDPNQLLPENGLDLILGGHLHIVTNPPKLLPNDDGSDYCKHNDCETLLVHSGAFAKYVGRLDLVVHVGTNNADPETRSRIKSFAYNNAPVDASIPDDPDLANLMWPYSVKINQEIDLNGVFSYVDPMPATAKILRNDLSGGDSQLGNLVARSMQLQEGVEAEFAITNSLGIRADFERGPLTIEQMYNVFPFENSITVMYLSGQEVQDTLDFVARKSSSRGCRTQAQVSGITFDMVCSGDCGTFQGQPVTACAKNIYIGDHCRMGNNPDGPVDPQKCARIDPSALYRVAVNDYIAAGGSGFEVLKRNSSKQDTGISLRDSLRVFLNGQSKCTDQIDESDTQMPQRKVTERYGNISCLTEANEVHDGRIRPVFE